MKLFVVYLCGPTDCFPHAAFVYYEDALEWANKKGTNPEGYVIEEQSLLDADWEW